MPAVPRAAWTPAPHQLLALRHALVAVLLPGTALLALTLWLAAQLGLPSTELLKDTLSVTGGPAHAGALSNVGAIGWTVIATLAGGAAALALSFDRRDPAGRYLLGAAALTGVLGVDDLFRVHDRIVPAMGVDEEVLMAFYGLAALVLCWSCRRYLVERTPMAVLGLAALLFGVGIAVDLLWHSEGQLQQIAEDGLKLLGILMWGAFHLPLSRRAAVAARVVWQADEQAIGPHLTLVETSGRAASLREARR